LGAVATFGTKPLICPALDRSGGAPPALPFPPPSLTQYKRFFHAFDKHSADFGAFLKKADLESSRKEKQHKFLSLCSLRSFAATILLDLHDSSLFAAQ
jgi:hypothetical protein